MGVPLQKASDSPSLPIEAQAISSQLVEKGYISYPYLGIRWQWLTSQITARYRLPVDGGLYVSYVAPGGPADQPAC